MAEDEAQRIGNCELAGHRRFSSGRYASGVSEIADRILDLASGERPSMGPTFFKGVCLFERLVHV